MPDMQFQDVAADTLVLTVPRGHYFGADYYGFDPKNLRYLSVFT